MHTHRYCNPYCTCKYVTIESGLPEIGVEDFLHRWIVVHLCRCIRRFVCTSGHTCTCICTYMYICRCMCTGQIHVDTHILSTRKAQCLLWRFVLKRYDQIAWASIYDGRGTCICCRWEQGYRSSVPDVIRVQP